MCLQRCLDHFLEQHRFAFLALQETHEFTAPVQRRGNVLRLSGPTHMGQLGCQIWVNLASDFGFDPRTVSIHYQYPRILVVLIHAGSTRLALISAHARTSAADAAYIRQWWADFHRRILALPSGVTPIVGSDANARFGAQDGQEFPANLNGHCLEDTCARFGLARTSAFEPDGRPRVSHGDRHQARGSVLTMCLCRVHGQPV